MTEIIFLILVGNSNRQQQQASATGNSNRQQQQATVAVTAVVPGQLWRHSGVAAVHTYIPSGRVTRVAHPCLGSSSICACSVVLIKYYYIANIPLTELES